MRKKRLCAVILCVVMLLALMPVTALAEEPGGGSGGGDHDDGGPGGPGPDDEAEYYTITLNVGENGSVTLTQRVADEDVPVVPDEENGNTYTVTTGSAVTFTFIPDPGYNIDELRVDDRPEWADQDNKFRIDNVDHNMQIEVSFIEVEEFTITVPQIDNGEIEVYNNGVKVALDENNQFTSCTRDMVSYRFTIDPGYKLKEFLTRQDDGWIEGVFTFYDPDDGMFSAEVETNFNYTLVIETEAVTSLPTPYFAILNSEADGGNTTLKAAIQRELGMKGIAVSDEDINIAAGTAPATASGVAYRQVTVDGLEGIAHFYGVNNAKTLLIMNEPADGDKVLTVYDGSTLNDFDPVTITIPAITSGKIYAFGPYDAFAMDMSRAIGLDLPVNADFDGSYIVEGAFYNMQWHVVNKGDSPETRVNWYPTNVVTEDAVYIEAAATKNGVTQMAGKWSIDTSPRVNKVDDDGTVNYQLEMFFGNDTVIISPPTGGNVTNVAVRIPSDSPGYSFEDEFDSVKVTFHSDFYDNITVPLTLTLGDDGTKSANVTIHRLGVEIQEHIREDRPGGDIGGIAHGTQSGSHVDLSEYGYRLTATYYIPDGGDIAPYGLFVTRTYSGGRVETETILVPTEESVFDHGESASAVDYIIYSGTDKATAPVSVSVLVLKDEPGDNTFGGVDFGSGTGVTWTKE